MENHRLLDCFQTLWTLSIQGILRDLLTVHTNIFTIGYQLTIPFICVVGSSYRALYRIYRQPYEQKLLLVVESREEAGRQSRSVHSQQLAGHTRCVPQAEPPQGALATPESRKIP